jgi:ATP-dependent helicase HrpA
VAQAETTITAKALTLEGLILQWLAQLVAINKVIKMNKNALLLTFAFADIHQQIENLFFKGFFMVTPLTWLKHYERYLNAIEIRLQKAPQNPQKDRLAMQEIQLVWSKHRDHLTKCGASIYAQSHSWQEYRYMVEELRVSLFAQTLKTAMPVSVKRLDSHWIAVLAETSGCR